MAHEQLRSSTIVRSLADVVEDLSALLQKRLSSRGRNFPPIFRQNCMADCGWAYQLVLQEWRFFFACKRLSSGSRVTASPFIGLF